MNNLRLLIIFIFLAVVASCSYAQSKKQHTDSLLGVWEDPEVADNLRFEALSTFIWEYHLFSKSDSVFYYIDLFLADANTKNNKQQVLAGLNLMGIGYDFRGNFAKAIDYYTKFLKLSEKLGDKRGISSASNNIGLIYYGLEYFKKSIDYYERSLLIKKEIKDSIGTALNYNNIGLSYFGLKEYDQALDFYLKSLALNQKINNKAGIAMALNNAGNVYLQKKELEKAKSFFQKSLDYEKQLNSKTGISTSMMSLGQLYYEEGNHKKAIVYAEKALELAKETGGILEIQDAAKTLWKIYKKQSRFSKSLQMHELYVSTRDTMLKEENQRETIQKEYQYSFDKEQALKKAEHEAELERQEVLAKAEKQRQTTIIYVTSGGLILVVLFSLLIFNRFKVTQKKNQIIQRQKEVVEEKSKEILDSIQYAKRIQSAILPPNKLVKSYLHDSFILYLPKDVVAGDFYWMEPTEKGVIFAAADCTGHGVPGAMVSVVCNNGLNRSVREYKLLKPADILDKTREIVVSEFEKSEEDVKDGMDISMVNLSLTDADEVVLEYAGANNPLWILRDGTFDFNLNDKMNIFKDSVNRYSLLEVKADKQPIGKYDKMKPYSNHRFKLKKGDSIYLFSDGFVDQFGGEKGKKFKPINLRKLLFSVQEKNMAEQQEIIHKAFYDWSGHFDQVDDVCFIGVRL